MQPSHLSSTDTQFQAAVLERSQELAPYGMLTTDEELRITSWNGWLETHSGIKADAAIGRSLLELFEGLISRCLDQPFKRALEGEVAVLSAAFHRYLLPFRNPLHDGGEPLMQQTSRIAPLLVDGQIRGTITVIEDVTQRERNSATLRRQGLRAQLLSSTLEQLLELPDPQSLLPTLLPRVAEHLGAEVYLQFSTLEENTPMRLQVSSRLTQEQQKRLEALPLETPPPQSNCLGATVLLLRAENCPTPVREHLEELGIGQCLCCELQVADRCWGKLFFGSRLENPFVPEDIDFVSTVGRYLAVALDRASTEKRLRRAQAELEHTVEDRTARLKETISQLESFSYTLAHDLRAPLRSMRGYAEVLLEEIGDKLSSVHRQFLAKIRVAATGMELLTRDLLEFSKITREQVQLEAIPLDQLLGEIVLLTPALQRPGVLQIHSPLPEIVAQRTLLQQCLSNLLENALKFVAPGVQPRITVRAEVRSHSSSSDSERARPPFQAADQTLGAPPAPNTRPIVRIWIEDNGIGIAPENHRKVFGIFERLQAREGYEGTGVGLAIVARAVQRMSGACGVESQLGRGSRFWIELPAA